METLLGTLDGISSAIWMIVTPFSIAFAYSNHAPDCAATGLASGTSPMCAGQRSEEKEVMPAKRAPARLKEPEEGPLNSVADAHTSEHDGSTVWALRWE
jgi:hypothetical protein